MGRPKGSKNKVKNQLVQEVKVVHPILDNPSLLQAAKVYVFENFGKLSNAELAKHTKLTEEEVVALATSKELDVQPVDNSKKPQRLRRFDTFSAGGQKGSVSMTQSQSMLDDANFQKNLPNQDEVNARIPGVEKIKVRQD